MRETEKIELPDTESSHLPLGLKKVQMETIPLLHIENKLMLYNRKYHFQTKQVNASLKPISKILA